MQNMVTRTDENGKEHEAVLYRENGDHSGFVIREMLETKNPAMAFQAGYIVRKPMRIPVYTGAVATSHRDGDDIEKFHLHGNGRTKEEAITRACNKLLAADIAKQTKN